MSYYSEMVIFTKEFIRKRLITLNLCWWFFILNIPVFWLAGVQYFVGGMLPQGWIAALYVWTSFLAHLAFLCLLTNLFCTFVALLWPRRAFVLSVAIVVNSIVLLNLAIDTVVFRLFHFHINWQLFSLVFSAQGRSVLDLGGSDWGLIILALVVILLFEFMISYAVVRKIKLLHCLRRSAVGLLGVLILSSVIGNSIYALSWAGSYAPVLAASTHLPLYARWRATGFVKKLHLVKIKKVRQYTFFNKNSHAVFAYPRHPLYFQAKKINKMNVLFIIIDTWRHDMLNPLVAPNIYRFSKNALVFANHFSGGNMTQSGIFSLFYGVPSTYWAAVLHAKKAPVLFDVLQHYHYRDAIYASAPLNIPFQFNKTVFRTVKDLQLETRGDAPDIRDETITTEMLKFLRAKKTKQHPFLGFLFYDAVHAYEFPKNFPAKFVPEHAYAHAELNSNTNVTPYWNLYRDAVVFDDSLVHKILLELKKDGYLKDTIVIITADHGEAFNDYHQDIWGHGFSFAAPVTHVPFIVYWPGKGHHIIKYYTSHYDIAPTLLRNLFHINNPFTDYSIGTSLFDSIKRHYIFVASDLWKFAVLARPRILVVNRSGYSYETDWHFKKIHAALSPDILHYIITTIRRFLVYN